MLYVKSIYFIIAHGVQLDNRVNPPGLLKLTLRNSLPMRTCLIRLLVLIGRSNLSGYVVWCVSKNRNHNDMCSKGTGSCS